MTTNCTRRRLLQMGGAAAGVAAAGLFGRAPRAAAADLAAAPGEPRTAGAKRVALFNLHTGEQLEVEFFRGGYVPDSLAAIQVLLRDFRNDEQHPIDPRLMDYLYDVARHAGVDPAAWWTFSTGTGISRDGGIFRRGHSGGSGGTQSQKGRGLIMPGFVDAHIHIESSMLPPAEFARLAVVHGPAGMCPIPMKLPMFSASPASTT